MIKKTFFAFFAILTFGCNSDDLSPDKFSIDTYKARNDLINIHCQSSDEVFFDLRGYNIKVPCNYIWNVSHFDADYEARLNEFSGFESIPVNSLQFDVTDPEQHNSFGLIKPPPGVVLNISYNKISTDVVQNHCFDTLRSSQPKQIWCQHYIPIRGTNLGVGLRFNASEYAFLDTPIVPGQFPYAYYTEEQWPMLYEQTQRFVRSIIN